MKIGIVGSWYDMLPLFTILHDTDHEFHVFADFRCGPWPDKSRSLQEERIEKGIVYLREQGVQKLIVPIWYELQYGKKHSDIIPLFDSYLRDVVLPASVVGKIWGISIGGDTTYTKALQTSLGEATLDYVPTVRQERTRLFQRPFAWWMWSVALILHMLPEWSGTDVMLRKLVKQSFRYFKDAAVDTLLPCDRSFLAVDGVVRKLCRERKIRYHGRSTVHAVWDKVSSSRSTSSYSVYMHTTDVADTHRLPKKRERLVSRGKRAPVMYRDVEIE